MSQEHNDGPKPREPQLAGLTGVVAHLQTIADHLDWAAEGEHWGPIKDDANRLREIARELAPADPPSAGHALLSEMDWSCRTQGALLKWLALGGVTTIGELAMFCQYDLHVFKNVGKKSIAEVEKRLAEYGLELAPSPPGRWHTPAYNRWKERSNASEGSR